MLGTKVFSMGLLGSAIFRFEGWFGHVSQYVKRISFPILIGFLQAVFRTHVSTFESSIIQQNGIRHSTVSFMEAYFRQEE